jgi:hypothetical protein
MKTLIYFAALILFQQASGCDFKGSQSQPCPAQAPNAVYYQRFAAVTYTQVPGLPFPTFLALDTQTGKLCRTRDTDESPPWVAALPVCANLVTKVVTNPNDPLGILDDQNNEESPMPHLVARESGSEVQCLEKLAGGIQQS